MLAVLACTAGRAARPSVSPCRGGSVAAMLMQDGSEAAGPWAKLQKGIKTVTGRSFETAANKIFDAADSNEDGSIDSEETYELVLKLYCQVNRRAPIKPPTKEAVNVLFSQVDVDANGGLTRQEFGRFCRLLIGRAAVRIAGFNVVRFGVAPLAAAAIASNYALLPIVRTLLSVVFIAFLGNLALAAVDSIEGLLNRDDPVGL